MKFKKSCIVFLIGTIPCIWNNLFAQNAYIQTDISKVSGIKGSNQMNSMTASGKRTSYTYLNGLGAPTQTVGYQQSPSSNDAIQIYQYDQYGQHATNYLPYVDNNSQNTKGSYRATAIADQQTYYINNSVPGNFNKVANDPLAFSQELFDNSPLHRLLAIGSNGLGFQPDLQDNTQHFTVISYRNNTVADKVMISPANGGTTFYPANALSITDLKNADGLETLVFKNSAGQTLLKRQVSGQSAEPYYDTYYVFNADGSTSYIIPPKAVHFIANGTYTNLSVAPLNNLIYSYTYDVLGRVITRKVPNTGLLSIVYDPMNRPILVQDGNEAQSTFNQWQYIKYDSRNRPITQGIYTDNTNLGQLNMQNYVTANYGTISYESRSSNSTTWYYSNTCFPIQNIQPLSFAYYDDYDLTQIGTPKYSYQSQGLVNGSGTNVEALPTANTQNMLTMILKRTVGSGLSNVWLSNVYFYDKHNNVIQIQSNNHLNFTQYTVTDYRTVAPDFVGKPLQVKVSKVTRSAVVNQVVTAFSYDTNNERVQTVSQTYNNQPTNNIVSYSYNDIGQIVAKQLGFNTTTNAYLQTLDYRYNIRNQLLSINNSTLSNDGGATNSDNTDLFGMTYLYDGTDPNLSNAFPSFSGRISAVKWTYKYNSSSMSNERSYVYKYDQLGQLNQALYAERAPGSSSTAPFNLNVDGFDETGITYDDNGNIKTLQRNYSSNNGSGGTPLDNLLYNYDTNNPDRLYQVTDAVTTSSTYGFNNIAGATASNNYIYDANGNLTVDPYKGISITYNLFNKTDIITAPKLSNSTINYTYGDAKSVLRKMVFSNGTVQTTTDYLDEFVYVNGTISYISMPEGRIINGGSTLKPEYIIADQQGNARFSFQDNGSGSPTIIQENSYYGFGAAMPGSLVPVSPATNNNNLYNGNSEWQNSLQNMPDYYQTGSRNYDPELGRFIGTDAMAELSSSLSNYHYSNNDPIMNSDPSGNCDIGLDFGCIIYIPPSYYQNTSNTQNGGGGGGNPGTSYLGNVVPNTSSSFGGAYNNGLQNGTTGIGFTQMLDGSWQVTYNGLNQNTYDKEIILDQSTAEDGSTYERIGSQGMSDSEVASLSSSSSDGSGSVATGNSGGASGGGYSWVGESISSVSVFYTNYNGGGSTVGHAHYQGSVSEKEGGILFHDVQTTADGKIRANSYGLDLGIARIGADTKDNGATLDVKVGQISMYLGWGKDGILFGSSYTHDGQVVGDDWSIRASDGQKAAWQNMANWLHTSAPSSNILPSFGGFLQNLRYAW